VGFERGLQAGIIGCTQEPAEQEEENGGPQNIPFETAYLYS
jgi:hypothetical protein